jgi:branched-chain amino acid transport system substrate-binding protein
VRVRTRNLLAIGVVLAGCSSAAGTATISTSVPSSPRTTITLPPSNVATTVPATDSAPVTTAPGPWHIDTSACPDPAAVDAPITGTLTVAMSAPLSGGVAAAQWKPVVDGFRTAIDHANLVRALGDVHLELKVVDDRADADRTEDALQAAIDGGAEVVAGVVGTDANLAVRFTLNEQCVPQLFGFSPSPALGDVAEYPWTIGLPPAVPDELGVLATLVRTALPGGGTLGVYAAVGHLGDDYVAGAADLAAATELTAVGTQRTGADDDDSAALDALAAARPDVVLAAPEGLDCTLFLRGLGGRRTAAPDWHPLVLLAAGCAVPAVVQLAGPTADGVYSTAWLADTDSTVVGMADYLTWMQAAGLGAEAAAAAPGWSAASALVDILQQAQQSPAGLSQASIIEAARSLDVPAPLGRPGVVLRTNGAADPSPIQSAQVVRWNAVAARFDAVGPVVTVADS